MLTTDRGRADACPTPVALHAAKDGHLARVRLPGGRVPTEGLAALASLSARLGDGDLDVTSRGNVQVRGLAPDAGAALAEGLTAAGLLPSASHDHLRGTTASPLGDLADLIAEVDEGLLAGDPSLSGRFLIALDDGSGHAQADTADVALVAGRLALAGRLTDLVGGAPLLLAAVRAFLALRPSEGVWRVADLGADVVAAALGARLGAPVPPTGRLPLGVVGSLRVVAAPLQRLDQRQLAALVATTGDVRFAAAGRVVVADGPLPEVGLLTEPGDPRAGVTACSGTQGCTKARADVRTLAPAYRGLVHLAGCERHCGAPHDAHVVEPVQVAP